MENSTQINAFVINGKKYNAFIFIYLFVGMIALIFLAFALRNYLLIFVSVAIFFGVPTIFEKRIRKPFSKKAQCVFFNDRFVITLYNINNVDTETENMYKYNEIGSFNTSSAPRNDLTSLKIYLKDGSKIGYTFYGQIRNGKKDINGLFFDYIKAYNNTHPENKVTIHPAYFATKASRGTVITATVLFVIAIAAVCILKPQIIPLALIPVLVFYVLVWGAGLSYRRQMKILAA